MNLPKILFYRRIIWTLFVLIYFALSIINVDSTFSTKKFAKFYISGDFRTKRAFAAYRLMKTFRRERLHSLTQERPQLSTHDDHLHQNPSKTSLIRNSSGKKTILIVISDTGGGHRSSAQAVTEALQLLHPDSFNIITTDVYTDYGSFPFNRMVGLYQKLASFPYLWGTVYYVGLVRPIKYAMDYINFKLCSKGIRRVINQFDPDLMISMHPLCNHLPLEVLSRNSNEFNKTKFMTIVTDLNTAHSTWFDRRAGLCIVPSNDVREIALRQGFSRDRVLVRGLPIRKQFYLPQLINNSKRFRTLLTSNFSGTTFNRQELRNRLGLKQNSKVVLVLNGGDGVGNILPLLENLLLKINPSISNSQIVVICGRNTRLLSRLESWCSDNSLARGKVIVKGYIDNPSEYMAAADLLISKAGPGTIAEATASGLPIILSSYLPGQETGNVDFVVKNGLGRYVGFHPTKIAECASNLLRNSTILDQMRLRATQSASSFAAIDIANDIVDFLFK